MRQLCPVAAFCLVGLTASAQIPSNPTLNLPPSNEAVMTCGAVAADSIAGKKLELAKQEVQRVSSLVQAGALPQVRIDQAIADVADAQDDAILQNTLYCDLPPQGFTEKMADDMVAAAQRRIERQQVKIQQAQALIADGITAQSFLTPLQEELKMRELNLDLARSRAKLVSELASLSRFEANMQQVQSTTAVDYRDYITPGMEHFEGTGIFVEGRDLRPLETAFVRKFAYQLPVSADGESAVHRSLGFDHRGRVDVALTPMSREGVWLKNYLKARGIPYYAFTRAMNGKATGAHIHIGPGSTRLHNAD